MKKSILIIVIVIIVGILIGSIIYNFSNNDEVPTNQNMQTNTTNTENEANIENTEDEALTNNNLANTNNTIENMPNEGDNENMENARIKLTVGENEIFVKLDDNQASREFLEMLPLTLTFEDYNNTEKIANLPNELSTDGLPSGYTPEIGDFAYYAPWGNISVFYKDFRYSNSLYKLGTIESGTEIMGNMTNDFEVSIERVD